jgi:hypothetical protein
MTEYCNDCPDGPWETTNAEIKKRDELLHAAARRRELWRPFIPVWPGTPYNVDESHE